MTEQAVFDRAAYLADLMRPRTEQEREAHHAICVAVRARNLKLAVWELRLAVIHRMSSDEWRGWAREFCDAVSVETTVIPAGVAPAV